MKKIFLLIASFLLLYFFVNAQKRVIQSSRTGNQYTLTINNGQGKQKLVVKGEVEIADNDQDVKSISKDGFVEYRNKNHTLKISNNNHGGLTNNIKGVEKSSPDNSDRPFIEECVQLMINNGVDAKNRANRIFLKNGVSGVLNEVQRFTSDYVKEIYLSGLLKKQSLTEQDMISILNKTDEYLKSDYYKSELLSGVMPSFLNQDATSDAYLNTVANMKSDYYQYTTLDKLLKSSPNENQYNKTLSIIAAMKSDYYQSEIIKTLLTKSSISERKFSDLMKIASQMKSDYYKSEIITALLKSNSPGDERYSQTIAAMQNLNSAYYQSEIISKLIDSKIKDELEWGKLIQYAGKINSDYYQSEVLVKIADKMPQSENLKSQLQEAARKIKSDYYYGRVARETETR